MGKIIAALRVSTQAQDEASQREQILAWAGKQGKRIDRWEADRRSGSIPWRQRGLGTTLDNAEQDDCIVVSEVSRIARSTTGVLTFLEAAVKKGVAVIACRNNLTIDNTLPSKITVTVLALAAEIERELIRERTTAALRARKAAGLPMGRPVGAKGISKCQKHSATIEKMRKARVSIRAIARMIECSPTTLYNYLNQPITTEAQP